MSVIETATTVQDQVLDAIKAGQEAILSAVYTLADSVTPITEKLPTPPFADKLVNPVELVNNYFSFASKLLPTASCEVIRLTVLTVSVVPAGIVAAFKDDATTQAHVIAISGMNLCWFISLNS